MTKLPPSTRPATRVDPGQAIALPGFLLVLLVATGLEAEQRHAKAHVAHRRSRIAVLLKGNVVGAYRQPIEADVEMPCARGRPVRDQQQQKRRRQ
jgi:hypothetical protein